MNRKIFERANVKTLCELLLYGVEDGTSDSFINTQSYSARLKSAYKMQEGIVTVYDKSGEDSQLNKVINKILNDYENIYMDLGIKTGFLLAKDIYMSESVIEGETEQYKEMYFALFGEVTKAQELLKVAQQKAEEIYSTQILT